jgi:hypothetical protein
MIVSPEDFVREWQLTDSTLELCEKWDVPFNTIATRAKVYRNKGIPLRAHKPGYHRSRKGIKIGPNLDVAALTVLANSLVKPGRPRRYESALRKRRKS